MREIWFALLGFVERSPGHCRRPAQAPAPHPMLADAQTVLAVTKDDRILGKPDAPITIVEYASLTCPHCAHFANDVLPELKKKWIDTGKAKLVLRDFPLDEPALRAAMIARCAPPERFYAVDRHVLRGAGEMGDGAGLPRRARAAGQARRHGQGGVRRLPQEQRAREQDRRRAA